MIHPEKIEEQKRERAREAAAKLRSEREAAERDAAEAIAARVRSAYIDPQNDAHFAYLESELGRSTWFAGEAFTAADIQMSFPIEARGARSGFGETQPRLAGFLERISARPAYRRALERGGPYAFAR
jgi:glutathione S-transferase